MAKPQVITIGALAGIGVQPAQQIPLDNSSGGSVSVTLINLDEDATDDALVLCSDDNFSPGTTWPLPAGNVIPQPDVDNVWVQNPNNSPVDILVLQGVVPVSLYYPAGPP